MTLYGAYRLYDYGPQYIILWTIPDLATAVPHLLEEARDLSAMELRYEQSFNSLI